MKCLFCEEEAEIIKIGWKCNKCWGMGLFENGFWRYWRPSKETCEIMVPDGCLFIDPERESVI